jgi:hypothetical protein
MTTDRIAALERRVAELETELRGSGEWEELDPNDDYYDEEDEMPLCSCPYCFCFNRTEFGICDDCGAGAHQG